MAEEPSEEFREWLDALDAYQKAQHALQVARDRTPYEHGYWLSDEIERVEELGAKLEQRLNALIDRRIAARLAGR